jgi:hypothetical protein
LVRYSRPDPHTCHGDRPPACRDRQGPAGTCVKQRFLNLGGDIVSGGPDDLAKAMRGGTEKWGRLVKEIDSQRK